MSNNLGQIYATSKQAEKYIILDSQNVEVSGNFYINGTNSRLPAELENSIRNYLPLTYGTTDPNPNTLYDVISEVSNNLLISNNDASFGNVDISGNLAIDNNLEVNGRVGIGYTSPREALDVNGWISSKLGFIAYAEQASSTVPNYISKIISFSTRTSGTYYEPTIYIGEIDGTTRHGFDFRYDYDGVGGNFSSKTLMRMYYTGSDKFFQVFADTYSSSGWGTSDDRLKTDEIDITDGLSAVRQMSPEIYKKWDNFEHTGKYTLESGYIAQEIEAIPQLSHCVKEVDGIKYINYDFLMAFHTASIKQLDAIITSQTELINQLEQRISNLENN